MSAFNGERVAVDEITVDGVSLAPDFGIEITPGPARTVWLLYAGKRTSRLATSEIFARGPGYTVQIGRDGKGVYRGHKPPSAA